VHGQISSLNRLWTNFQT